MKQTLIFIFGLGLFCFSSNTSLKAQQSVPDDYSEYYYHISHLIKDTVISTPGKLTMPDYMKNLDFLDGYKIPTFSAKDMNGNIQNVDYKSKLTLLNFWNIDCSPCVEEMRYLNVLQQRYSEKLQVISLCLDSEADIAKFLEKHHLEFIVIPAALDIVENRFKMQWGYPKSILVGQDGNVLGMIRGILGTDDLNFNKIDRLILNYHSVE